MNAEIISSNLKTIRSRKKITQQQLSELSGVSLPTIKLIERKKGLPKTNTLLALSKGLNCKLQDLVQQQEELSAVRFRIKKTLKRRQEILSIVSQWLDDYTFLEEELTDREDYKLQELSNSTKNFSPKEYAEKARQIIGLKNNEPIHNICGLLESCGIKILALPYSSDVFNGLSVGKTNKGPAIIINTWEKITTERQIFSAAHELGHLLMHLSDYNGNNNFEEIVAEQEANLFAGYFLLPQQGFDSEWIETAGMPLVDRVLKIKTIFKVSYKAVLYRLLEKGIVDDTIWFRFNQLYRAKYNKKLAFKEEPNLERSEPFGLIPFHFYADRLSRLVRKALEQEIITLSRAAEILKLSTQQMMDRVVEWESFH